MNLQDKFNNLTKKVYIDPNERVEYPPVAISYGYYKSGENYYPVPLGTYGNFSFIQAAAKSKKTFLVSMLCSCYLTGQTSFTGDLLGHRGELNLVHFDTEQGKFHAQKVFQRVLKMAETDNSFYDTYGLRTLSIKDRNLFIELYLEKNYDKTGVMIIDGVADLVSDVNDIKESNDIVQKIMYWTEKYNIHIVCVIHSNHNSDKPTGHLGSSLEKKTETQIRLQLNEDDENIVQVHCKRSRSIPFEDFSFEVCRDGYPRIIDKIDSLLNIKNGNKT
jgi:hypothetical protein|tara:strand:+ start:1856 stop:2680 length:825 start_codon:yes stop_codon:yes gene_type:complete